jgi:hypothetical protein
MFRTIANLMCLFSLLVADSVLFAQLTTANANTAGTSSDQATDKQSPAALQDRKMTEARQLSRIGNLNFSITNESGVTIEAFDQSREPRAEDVYLELKDPPSDLVANYRFPGEAKFHPLAHNGVSSRILMPQGTSMVLVSLTWCKTGCVKPNEADAPYTCPEKAVGSEKSSPDRPMASPNQEGCRTNVVFVRELTATTGELLPAFIISANGLEISEALLEKAKSLNAAFFTLNGTPISEYFSGQQSISQSSVSPTGVSSPVRESLFGWSSVRQFHIDRYPFVDACSLYLNEGTESIDVDRPRPPSPNLLKDNGIKVAAAKVFDTFTLRQMLASTAAQLASISGFNQASITGAFGNLQGITVDTSYLSAQVTTLPTPTVSSVVANGGATSNTLANTLGVSNGLTASNSTITCPPGTLPAVGTSGLPACAPLITGTATVGSTGIGSPNGGSSTLNGSQSNSNATLSSANTGVQTANQQNTVTTNSGGQAGVVAPVPVSNSLTAPTNVGVSASDILAEQVQLNSQITTYRLLLQGALSDQYLLKESRAVATRQQTTVGFGISLNPPERYKHAVAEVKIWIDSPSGDNDLSIMNLLPAAKTYNVAKVTSHQNAFGAGVIVEPVNVGVAAGRSKNRLFLAKDTDTVAIQFSPDEPESTYGASLVPRSTQEHIRDAVHQAIIWQSIDDACTDDPKTDTNSIVFGWQFRPVLGAAYVEAGERYVYAQLALPTGLGEQFAPTVHVQTRWREYDSKHQVVGPVYRGSCSISEDPNPITVISPLRVHRVTVDDMGNGLLKVKANGNFFSSGFSVLSGPNTVTPITFDGKSFQFFGNAGSLLMTDDLKLIGEDGRTSGVGMGAQFGPDACRISSATMTAVPRPDGNSLVEATFSSGRKFSLDIDKAPRPLVLIGSQVYGLHETPYVDESRCTKKPLPETGIVCKYRFLASTNVLRSAQTFTVRDLAWSQFKKSGTIDFQPSFAALAILGTKPSSTSAVCPSVDKVNPPACTPPPLYTLTGFDLDKVKDRPTTWSCQSKGCLQLYQGLNEVHLTDTNFQVLSKTTAVLQLSPQVPQPAIAYDYKSLRFIFHSTANDAVEWDLSVPAETKTAVTASAILNVGDSTQLVFSGVELSGNPQSLLFDNVALEPSTYKYDSSKKTLTVEITTAITSKPGHKEMTLTDSILGSDQKPKQIQLPFEVTRR